MILSNNNQTAPRFTLDDLFRRAAIQNPEALALCDPPNRAGITGTSPRWLNYLEVDNAVSAIAVTLRGLGLNTDAVIAYQLPNTAESALMLLGIARAGMIALPLPMLWREREIIAALSRTGATTLVTTTKIDDVDHVAIAMQAAAGHFPVRHVCAFGPDVPDGVVPLDGVFTTATSLPQTFQRDGHPADHVALLTMDTGQDGLFPVARSHAQLVAATAPCFGNSAILTPVPLSSFAGIALALLPALQNGVPLVLHHPFDDVVFEAQRREHRCGTVILPGSVVGAMKEAGNLTREHGPHTVVALWRSAETWRNAAPSLDARQVLDRVALGETAIAPAARGADGKPQPVEFSALTDAALTRITTGAPSVHGWAVPDAA